MLCWIMQFFFSIKPGCWFIYLKSLNHFFLKILSLSKQRHLINFATPSNPGRNHESKAGGANTKPCSISQDSNLCCSRSLHMQRREEIHRTDSQEDERAGDGHLETQSRRSSPGDRTPTPWLGHLKPVTCSFKNLCVSVGCMTNICRL